MSWLELVLSHVLEITITFIGLPVVAAISHIIPLVSIFLVILCLIVWIVLMTMVEVFHILHIISAEMLWSISNFRGFIVSIYTNFGCCNVEDLVVQETRDQVYLWLFLIDNVHLFHSSQEVFQDLSRDGFEDNFYMLEFQPYDSSENRVKTEKS